MLEKLLRDLPKLTSAQRAMLQIDLELEARRRKRAAKATEAERLIDFILRISPSYKRPSHLAPLLELLERTEREPVRAIVNVPPRFSKTECLLHAIAYRLRRRPWETVAYVTYGNDLSNSKSRLAREYARRAGVALRGDSTALHEWRTPMMGGALFSSIQGGITGQGANVLVIDDPHKDRAEAESQLHRDRVWEWYIGTATDRVEPGGSIIVTQTRWHPDDLSGRLKDGTGGGAWTVISLPALGVRDASGTWIDDDNGESLWPERWPTDVLLKKKVDEYEWQSKYQQKPTRRGGAVFRDVRWYNPAHLGLNGCRISIGIDLAYSEKTKSHHSACVALAEQNGVVYVLSVDRKQLEVPAFAEIIKGVAALYPGAKVRWHTSTTEAGTAQLLKLLGVPVKHELAKADKFIRAQPIAAKWNAGLVRLPGGFDEGGRPIPKPTWVAEFVTEVTGFTGSGDRHDDQVDAFASAYSAWTSPPKGRHDSDDTDFSFG